MGKTIQLSGFPDLVPGETVKEFLEKHTGRGTVEAVEVREPKKTGSRPYAIVQFTTAKYADYIIYLANRKLYYENSYLKAYRKDFDLVQKPKAYVHDMESVTLHFGCQISKEKFSVLWKMENITVKFGFVQRKMYFFFSYLFIDYKLELSFDNIWQLELHRPRGQTSKFLLIQVSSLQFPFCNSIIYFFSVVLFLNKLSFFWALLYQLYRLNNLYLLVVCWFGFWLDEIIHNFLIYKKNMA